jgi:siroheme synthase
MNRTTIGIVPGVMRDIVLNAFAFSEITTVDFSTGRTVVTGRDDSIIFHNDRTIMSPETC